MTLTYEQFFDTLKQYILIEVKDAEVGKTYKAHRNNEPDITALPVLKKGTKTAITFYPEELYELYQEDGNLDAVFIGVVNRIKEVLPTLSADVDRFGDFSRIRDSIVPRLVNTKANRKTLADAPHIDFLDLSIAFHIFIPRDEMPAKTGGNGAVLVRNEMLGKWGISVEKLFRIAKENGVKRLPPWILKNNPVLMLRMMQGGQPGRGDIIDLQTDTKLEGSRNFILTNMEKWYGAATILYDGVLKRLAEMAGTDLLIIPSSTHECIIEPLRGDFDRAYYRDLITRGNQATCTPDAVLSDHAYVYRRAEDKVTC